MFQHQHRVNSQITTEEGAAAPIPVNKPDETGSTRHDRGIFSGNGENGGSNNNEQEEKKAEYVDRHEEEKHTLLPRRTIRYLSILLGLTLTLSTLTATIYFPLLPALSAGFGRPLQDINLTVTVYAVFQAVSPAFFGGLADLHGRRSVLLGLIGTYALASLALFFGARSGSYAVLMVMRAVQSVAGSPMPALGYGVVSDVVGVEERGKYLGIMLTVCNGISAVGPVVGGGVATIGERGYVWVFLALLGLSAGCFLLVGFTLPETGSGRSNVGGVGKTWSDRVLRGKGTRDEGVVGGGNSDERELESSSGVEKRQRWQPLVVFKSLRILFYPDALVILWTIASTYSIYYTFQVAISPIFDEIYGYNELFIGLAFLPALIGMTLGGIVAGQLMDYNLKKVAEKHHVEMGERKKLIGKELGDFPIEGARYRLCIPIIVVEMLLVAGYGWAVQYHVHASVPLILQFFTCGLSTLLSHMASGLVVEVFPDNASSAYAASQIMRCGLSAVAAAVLQPLVDAVDRGWFFVMLALFVGVTAICSILVSVSKGVVWRKKRLNA